MFVIVLTRVNRKSGEHVEERPPSVFENATVKGTKADSQRCDCYVYVPALIIYLHIIYLFRADNETSSL